MNMFKKFTLVIGIIAAFNVNANEEYGSYNNDPNKLFDATNVYASTIKVTWVRVKKSELTKTCNQIRAKHGIGPMTVVVDACTIWDNTECTIVTPTSTTMGTFGHESRHCFQRAWH